MNHLEIISVRLAEKDDFNDAMQMCANIMSPVEVSGAGSLKIYRSNGPGTDLSAHIHWTIDVFGEKKSLSGLQIAKGLSNFGIVSHTVWIDQSGSVLCADIQTP